MRIKGDPLKVNYKHIDYTNSKTGEVCHKTIASCTVLTYNVPIQIVDAFCSLFEKESDGYSEICKIYAETVCKGGDSYDPKVGERIARKKIMKRFMSMVRQASDKTVKNLQNDIEDVKSLSVASAKCRDDIIEFLQNQ